jgi:SAM-dependent methyltransferase
LSAAGEFSGTFAGAGVDLTARDLPGLKADFIVGHVQDGAVLVDIGCGGGKMLRTIKQHRGRVTLLGCDVAEPMGAGVDFAFAPIDQTTGRLPYEDSSIDIALMVDVLEHVDRPEKTLAEIHRILKSDGRLVAFIPIEGESMSWFSLFRLVFGKDLYARTKGHIQAFTHDEVEHLLEFGFVIDERRYVYHVFGQLMDAALCASLSIGWIERAFWDHSPYHGGSDSGPPSSIAGRAFAAVLRLANAVAWAESTALRNVRTSSAGILLMARRCDRCVHTGSSF